MDNTTFYQATYNYEKLEDLYSKATELVGVSVNKLLYNQRKEDKESMESYKFMINCLIIMLIAALVFCIILFAYKDTNAFIQTCIILGSLKISLHKIKKYYYFKKISYVLPLAMIATIIGIVVGYILFEIPIMICLNAVILMIFLMILYSMIICLCLKKLSYTSIGKLMKEKYDK